MLKFNVPLNIDNRVGFPLNRNKEMVNTTMGWTLSAKVVRASKAQSYMNQ